MSASTVREYYSDAAVTLYCGDALTVLRTLPDASVQCCVTSPPYWGLRDYGTAGQIGLEATPEEYVARMVEVFREVRRVLREDGTLWLNLGDSYAANGERTNNNGQGASGLKNDGRDEASRRHSNAIIKTARMALPGVQHGLKPKDLVGIPWRVAFALQADGWYLRSDVIWSKPNPMPESVRDRPTKAHEYVFLLAKSKRYHYDADAVAEDAVRSDRGAWTDTSEKQRGHGRRHAGFNGRYAERILREGAPETRNCRSVWTITPASYPEAHFATFPPELPRLCIMAGCPEGGTVLDPFAGAGTTGYVAKELNRRAILIELSEAYCALIPPRISQGVLDFSEAPA